MTFRACVPMLFLVLACCGDHRPTDPTTGCDGGPNCTDLDNGRAYCCPAGQRCNDPNTGCQPGTCCAPIVPAPTSTGWSPTPATVAQ